MTWRFEYIANVFTHIKGGAVKGLDKHLIIEKQNPFLKKQTNKHAVTQAPTTLITVSTGHDRTEQNRRYN